MKVIFTNPMPHRVSTTVIAKQPVEYLRALGVDADYVPEQYFDYNCDVVVFAKQCNIEIAEICKKKGIKTVWFSDDGLFYKQAEKIIRKNEFIDAIISTCEDYTNFIKSLGFKNQVIKTIYHHHCNFSNQIAEFRETPMNVGYIGVLDQFHHVDYVTDFVQSNSMNMVIRDQKDIRYLDIDIGIAFIDKNYPDTSGLSEYLENSWVDRLSYRSNAKIVNHMSYGIPTIASKYSSYLEVDKIAPGCAIFCDTKEEVNNAILTLKNDKKLRKQMRDNCLSQRDKFHMKNVIKEYKSLFESLL